MCNNNNNNNNNNNTTFGDYYETLQDLIVFYRGADKSLARPGGKKATATEDFVLHISYL